jgi:DNA polymerase-3 subunit alpha (Gram-positive type)
MTTFVIDYESSGLNPYHEDIIEIAIKVYGKDISYESLVIPKSKKPISAKITEITGITNQLLKEKGLNHKDAYTKMISFIEENTSEEESFYLVAHNGQGFDFIFFKKALHIMNKKFDNVRYVDSLFLSKVVNPSQYSHSMKTLCKVYNVVNEQEHRALGDVNALEKIMDIMMKKGNLSSVEEVYNATEFI